MTDQQIDAIQDLAEVFPPRLLNPRTNETFVLVPLAEYQRLKHGEYDDSPWTREELQVLAWQAGAPAGWNEMDEYDELPE